VLRGDEEARMNMESDRNTLIIVEVPEIEYLGTVEELSFGSGFASAEGNGFYGG
jgi:hypothetical protein